MLGINELLEKYCYSMRQLMKSKQGNKNHTFHVGKIVAYEEIFDGLGYQIVDVTKDNDAFVTYSVSNGIRYYEVLVFASDSTCEWYQL